MRNLFDTITNSLGQFTQQGQSNNGNQGKSNGSSLGQLGAIGVGGLLGALVDNPKNMKKTIKKAALIGGGAALGGLAYNMYQKWRNNSNGQQSQMPPQTYQNQGMGTQGGYKGYQNQGSYQSQGGFAGGYQNQGGFIQNGGFNPHGGFGAGTQQVGYQAPNQHQLGYQAQRPSALPKSTTPVAASQDPFAAYNSQQQAVTQVDSDALSDLLLEAMVFAARADNHIDADEKQMIMKVAQELNPTQNLMNKITTFLNEPLDPNTLARKLPDPAMAPDLYRLSAAAIVADTPIERQYLQALANALNLSAQQVEILNNEARQFRQQVGQ